MAFTSLKKLSVQSAGSASGTWGAGGTTGVDINTGVTGPIDTMLAGLSTFSLSSSNVSLTFTAGGGGDVQNAAWRFTGVLLADITVSPTAGDATTYFNGFYYFEQLTTGAHTVTVTTGAGSVVLPQSRRGVMFVDGTNGPRLFSVVGSANPQVFPAGTVSPFYQNAAPTGWTIVSSLNDYGLRIVSSAGGVSAGSVNYSTLFARTAVDSYTLLAADIPAHTHSVTAAGVPKHGSGGTNVGTNFYGSDGDVTSTVSTSTLTSGSTGGSGGHVHAIDMRVKTADLILATLG